jgi:ADP-heptose:LPS heptosyltransferase
VDPKKCLAEAGEGPLLQGGGRAAQKKRIVFHPGSGGEGKNYPPEFWLKLIGKLTSHFPSPSLSKSIILLGPAEEQLLPCFTSRLDGERSEILFAPELEQLQSILSQAPLYVGHDSGITHLAAMLGTPTVALFRMSTVHQWRPLGPAVKVIQSEESSPGLIVKILEEIMPLASRG